MKVAVCYSEPVANAAADDLDTLVQRDAVMAALKTLGHEARPLGATLDLQGLRAALAADPSDIVFNLIESLEGKDRLLPAPPMLFDALGLRYTGSSSTAILQTTNKLIAKRLMRAAGLPTADWIEITSCVAQPPSAVPQEALPRWLLKSVWEHASFGMDASSILHTEDHAAIQSALAAATPRLGGEAFAERYIAGREFNVSILDGPDGPQLLPPAEIEFHGFAPGQPRLVDWRAKWDESSTEYRNTRRQQDFSAADSQLLGELARLALDCWRLFGMSGWARVDFRVDESGQPYVLEVNANPCLSPDAGFAAALARGGIAYEAAIERIIEFPNRQPVPVIPPLSFEPRSANP